MNEVLIISLGAVAGANARYFLGRVTVRFFGPVFPYGTLLINTLGSFIVGFFVIWTSQRMITDPRWRLLVMIGFCGSFTTFSGYSFETVTLLERGEWLLMWSNILSNNLLCLAAVVAGMAIARVL